MRKKVNKDIQETKFCKHEITPDSLIENQSLNHQICE